MTPAQLSKNGTEHGHQVALFAYCAVAYRHGFNVADEWASGMGIDAAKSSRTTERGVWPLQWIHAIPNGGTRGDDAKSRAIRGAALKAEGVRQGVADVFLPFPYEGFHGLYIEMKKPSVKPKSAEAKGAASDEQIEFGKYATANGYMWAVCYSWEEAVAVIKRYLGVK